MCISTRPEFLKKSVLMWGTEPFKTSAESWMLGVICLSLMGFGGTVIYIILIRGRALPRFKTECTGRVLYNTFPIKK